jgi:methionyl-tRNA synthetase
VVLKPIMPDTAEKMAAALGMNGSFATVTMDAVSNWGALPAGLAIDRGAQLFPRLEKKAAGDGTQVAGQGQARKKAPAPGGEGLITLDHFKAVELRVGEIIAAEKVAKSERLLKLTVLVEEERTIVAGIAAHYSPETLIGQRVIVATNLKPAKLMGILSHGMVLAAKEEQADGTEKLVLATVAGPIAPGSRVA